MTYRVGNHQPQNVYRDDAYIGVMFTAEDAALVVEALNPHTPDGDYLRGVSEALAAVSRRLLAVEPGPLAAGANLIALRAAALLALRETAYELGLTKEPQRCPHGHPGGERCGPCSFDSAIPPSVPCTDEWQSPHRAGSRPNMCTTCSETSGKLADSCTCTKAGPDPACVVHQGRRAKGPKPPPLGVGCICDGSGRTCPRHGAVS